MTATRIQGLGDAIRQACVEKDLTLTDASLSLGLAPNTMSRWVNGVEPTAQFYEVLMDFLGVSLYELGAMIVVQQMIRAGLPLP